MLELVHAAFSPVNLVLTVLLILTILYWITVILGVLDVNLFDVDLGEPGLDAGADFDVGADVDADLDAGGEMDADAEMPGLGRSILHFFYVGEVPTMVLVSILILSMWTVSMAANHYLNPNGSFVAAVPLFLGNVVASALIMKVFAMPLKKLYSALNRDSNAPRSVIGRICVVTTTTVSDKMGQAEVKTRGAPIVLNVVSDGDHVFHKGDEAVVIGKIEEKGVHTIAPVDLER